MANSTIAWNEVRRSTPAEHVEEIPDEAIEWAVWILPTDDPHRMQALFDSITIYTDYESYWVVTHDSDGEAEIHGFFGEQDQAESKVEILKEEAL